MSLLTSTDDEHARTLEDQWIETLDDPGLTPVNQSSTSETILQGLIVGFFFPLMPFFFLREGRQAVFWENGSSQERQNSVVFTYAIYSDRNKINY